jgi:signal transduction histidine kinase/CheY-like chemotaxis protein
MKKQILSLYIITVLLVILLTMVWEFWLEPVIQPYMVEDFRPESVSEKWEFIKTVFIFCTLALLAPAFLALKIDKKRKSSQESLIEFQKRTENLLNERTVELTKSSTKPKGKKLTQLSSDEQDETINISLQLLIDCINDSIMVIDNNYEIRMLNKAARAIYFKDSSPPQDRLLCHQLSHKEDQPCSGAEHECPFEMVRESGKPQTVTHYHADKHGNMIPFEIQASPIFNDQGDVVGIVELARDVSSRIDSEQKQRETEARILNLQREQSIASLAGGLAHEFNNILTSILGNAELLSVRLDETNENKKQTDAIIAGSEHLGLLTKQLLAFAREGKYLNKSIDVNEQIRDVMHLVYTDTYTLYEVEMDLTVNPWSILADPAQISQLIMNIVVNGFEALEGTKGKLIIRTENHTFNEKWKCWFGQIHPPGDYVLISITNTGSSIPDDMADRVFEPFYSGRLDHKGLGLAAAKGIVQIHNGSISLESDLNQTTFKIFLPREMPEQELVNDTRDESNEFTGLRVLVVDDEPEVLSIITNLLDHHKCNVLSAGKGEEALKTIERHRDNLDLVILDIQMPDMSGDKVYHELKKIKPGLKVLITSGHAEYIALKNIMLAPTDKFIKKPFRMSDLMLSIKDVLVRN